MSHVSHIVCRASIAQHMLCQVLTVVTQCVTEPATEQQGQDDPAEAGHLTCPLSAVRVGEIVSRMDVKSDDYPNRTQNRHHLGVYLSGIQMIIY